MKKLKYDRSGFISVSRKWLAGDLAQRPSAFTIYVHLIAWANYKDGKLKRGQVALGERDLGTLLGMSVNTIRRHLRWLRDEGWILLEPKVWGTERGTIVTVLYYEVSQNFQTYKFSDEFQERMLLPHSEDQKLILEPLHPEDQKLIPELLPEDQKLILNPAFEDQKLIPHILIPKKNTKAPPGPPEGGEKGAGLPAGPISATLAVKTILALCDAGAAEATKEKSYKEKFRALHNAFALEKINRAKFEAELTTLNAEYGRPAFFTKKKKPAVKKGGDFVSY